MKLSILIRPPRSGQWIRVVVIVVIVMLISRWSPGVAVPLGLGSWAGWTARVPGQLAIRSPGSAHSPASGSGPSSQS
jgi:hypothetical protein